METQELIKIERAAPEKLQVRQLDNGSLRVEGYAAVYNVQSRLLFDWGDPFYEVIAPGAFDDALARTDLNVIANYQHNDTNILARSISGTLTLSTDEKGLKYEFDVPNTELGRSIAALLERGDLFESSFRFTVTADGYRWMGRNEEGIEIREITKVNELLDVAIVTNAAYPTTDVGLSKRDLERFKPVPQKKRIRNLAKYIF